MLPDPRRFLEKLAEREQAAWARRARYLNEGQTSVTTSYSVYAVSDGTLARMHSRGPGGRGEVHDSNARWLLIGYLTTEGAGEQSRYALVDRGRKGDKAVFWKAGASRADLEAARFIITSKLVEDPRRVLVRPRSTPAQAVESTVLLHVPPAPRVPSELVGEPVATPTAGVFAGVRVVAPLPPTLPPPRRPSAPPLVVTPLQARPLRRLPLPSLRTLVGA